MEHFNMHAYGYFIIIIFVRNLIVFVQSVLSNLVCDAWIKNGLIRET